jgi:hypothetical protein
MVSPFGLGLGFIVLAKLAIGRRTQIPGIFRNPGDLLKIPGIGVSPIRCF